MDYALNDADAMKRYLIYSLGYRQGNIIDVRDATLGDLQRIFGTEREHRGRLFDFIRDGESDVTVFYSGTEWPGLNDKRGYLLPIDGDPDRAEIAASRSTSCWPTSPNCGPSVHVFLDACFSGNSAGGMLIQATSGIGISPALPDAAGQFRDANSGVRRPGCELGPRYQARAVHEAPSRGPKREGGRQ